MNDSRAKSRESIRAELAARVRARRGELEEAIFARVRELSHDPTGAEDAEYVTGLRTAVAAAVDLGLMGIERGAQWSGSIPPEAVAQAHRAARAGVSLDTVLRRYMIGSTLLGDYVMQEADHSDFVGRGAVLRDMLSAQAALLDRLMASITGEYMREVERAVCSPERRRAERVQRLLAGESADATAFEGYELDAWHLAVIATGAAAVDALRRLAAALDRRLLQVSRGEETVWAWLGGTGRLPAADLERAVSAVVPPKVSLAAGEPGSGVERWRLSHRQAQAAQLVAIHSPRQLTRYADVALLASVLRDAALARSLVEIYLDPLGENRNGGAALRQTLRAYFAAERNASSTASALGVARHTVENRLRAIEQKLGQRLHVRQAELELALRLEELEDGVGDGPAGG